MSESTAASQRLLACLFAVHSSGASVMTGKGEFGVSRVSAGVSVERYGPGRAGGSTARSRCCPGSDPINQPDCRRYFPADQAARGLKSVFSRRAMHNIFLTRTYIPFHGIQIFAKPPIPPIYSSPMTSYNPINLCPRHNWACVVLYTALARGVLARCYPDTRPFTAFPWRRFAHERHSISLFGASSR